MTVPPRTARRVKRESSETTPVDAPDPAQVDDDAEAQPDAEVDTDSTAVGRTKTSAGAKAAEKAAENTADSSNPALALTLGRPSIDVRAWLSTAREGVRTLMARPLTSFHLVVSLSLVLTVCGLIMVQSASSVEGYAENQSSYGAFATQAGFAVLGWIAFYTVLHLPFRFFRRFAALGMVVSLALLVLVLVPSLGVKVDGARRWFEVGGVSIQPSELAKLALCIWGAHVLASRRTTGAGTKELLVPLLPVAFIMCVLIIAEPNLSTTVIVLVITGALLWFGGLSASVFAGFVGFVVVSAAIAALSADYRAARVFSFLGSNDDPLGGGYQALQATYALANGGIFGVGLGQSTAKWSYLPNAHNDFIFAILVEETGLVGGMIVVGLFLLLGWVGMRIARRSADPFLRLLTATITVLITTQMFINVGYVVGLLPVTGIQLPLMSQGGTSMLTMLTMLGLLASAARHEPDAVAALSGSKSHGLSRLLHLPPPAPYRQRLVDQVQDRLDRRRSAGRAPEPRGNRRQGPSQRVRPGPGDRVRSAPRERVRPMRSAAQHSDEIHYPPRQASNRVRTDPRRYAPRYPAADSPRRTEYRQR
ncbi:putative lipid II flippase FtsW [Gordonia alkaliphila]|uniref:putative lipid II flippase FtsW n=1 Tax=Gordonia alkaliphila TaxID=1053547 RepID=UPI001FF51C69|nr:putative lipid II flippase FtsW [Gordonia alkaliphila]MCK0440957.1 putative lipid II flippase FtsW [Gordonia alkaliphila]